MALRASLARMFGAKASIIGLSPDELPDRALEKAFDDASLLSVFGDDAWPYILNNKVGEQASQAPLQIGRMVAQTKGKPPEFEWLGPDHPVQQLFDAPITERLDSLGGARTTQMDGGEFVHLLTLYMGLTGHCPIEIVRPRDGLLIGAQGRRGSRLRDGFELWLTNPGPWRIVPNSDGTIRGYLWIRAGQGENDIRWTPDQMTYLRWPNPASRWYGQGHIQAVRQQVMAEEYAAVRDKRFEKQLGVPPGILTSELPLGDTQATELQKRWEKAVGGYQNAGRIAVLGSKTTYQAVQQSARDSEWLNVRHDRVEIMAAAVGVPLPLVRMQDATFSNVQDARAEFWEGTLAPRLNRIGRMLTVRLLPLISSEPLVARFDLESIEALAENDLQAAQTAAQWSNTGGVLVDEVRKRLGLEALGGDAGQRLLIPSTLTLQLPTEIAEKAALGMEAAQAGIDGQRATAEADRAGRDSARDEQRPPRRRAKAETAARAALLAPIIEGYKADLASYFAAQHNAISNTVGKALPLPEDERALIDRIIGLVTAKRFRERLLRISRQPIETSLTLGATEAARTLGVGVSYAIPTSEAALAQVTTHLNALGVGIENTTVDDVRRVLDGALRDGADNAAIRARLGDLFDGYGDWRLDRISRTEVTNAYNLGALGQYKAVGVSEVHVSDGDLDGPCADADGSTWTIDRAEQEPTSHPNCSRVFSPVTTYL